ncbi:signal peptidase I [Curtobacterium pusillum]|uniref:Signal peptidase I n=1 Tax=Curtobacterium pusillum TaxID=69373 RepID=A0ABX2M842_9MICO|nr:signal peptidase I [Curtobacterium pusillum]NUU13070.1 signal peptidase I [Curtobacterium pusillum]
MSTHASAPQHRAGPAVLGRRGGWGGLLLVTTARAYLTFVAALATIAFLPALFGWTGSVVQTGSMEPRISPGDVVLTTPLPATSPLPVGRVITFRTEGELVVHRLVHVDPDNSLVTKGDANPDVDSWRVTRHDITGQARLLVPYAGLPVLWLSHGNTVAFITWAALTLAAIVLAAFSSRTPEEDDTTNDPDPGPRMRETTTPSPVSRTRATGHQAARVSRIAIGAAAVVAIGLASPGIAHAQGFFTEQTRATASWTTKAYAPIAVGSMAGYAAVANTSVTDGSLLFHFSTAYGSVATSPGSTVSGVTVSGSTERNTAAAARAMASATAARSALNERPTSRTLNPSLSGTLNGGVYTSTTGAFSVPGTLVLDAKGDSSARFVFRTSSALTMAEGAKIVLANGAKPSNVWWIVGTTATLGTNTTIFGAATAPVGNYLVNGAASLRGADLTGRVVSYTNTITLSASTITPTD